MAPNIPALGYAQHVPLISSFQTDAAESNEPGVDSSWDEWVSASETYNFCCEDPLIDWFELHGEAKGFARDDGAASYDHRTDFRLFVSERAKEFEAVATDYLTRTFSVTRITRAPDEVKTRAAVEATWNAMASHAEIISQGALWNPEMKVYGAPDLLVRSDILQALFPADLSAAECAVRAPALPPRDSHYRVVDLKYTTLELLKNGHAASDHDKYMVQVWLYNEALGRLQGYTPPSAHLVGRRWKKGKDRGTSALERLARVDHNYQFKNGNTLRSLATGSCDWIRRVREHGAGWQILPTPSVPELWPNLKRTDDQPWHHRKREVAHQLEDLTLLPRVTRDKRAAAVAQGLSRWTDPRCDARALGITGDKNPAIVDAVIKANQSPAGGEIVFPDRVTVNEGSWRAPIECEFYVDFETVSDLDDDLSSFPNASGQALIFMIGCGHYTATQNGLVWNHRLFLTQLLTEWEERRIIEEWLAHMTQVSTDRGVPLSQARIFHWSPAETSTLTEAYNSANQRHGAPGWPTLPWFDLLNDVVKEQPVTVRGAFGFGLKSVAKAMHTAGLITTLWETGPTDGLGAMVGAWWCNREARRTGQSMSQIPLMQEISEYNEIDCRVMAEVLAYLRARR